MTEAEKARFRRQCEDLAEAENDDMGTPAERRRFVTWVNDLMAPYSSEPFIADDGDRDDEEPPELGIHRRIRSLGMARLDR